MHSFNTMTGHSSKSLPAVDPNRECNWQSEWQSECQAAVAARVAVRVALSHNGLRGCRDLIWRASTNCLESSTASSISVLNKPIATAGWPLDGHSHALPDMHADMISLMFAMSRRMGPILALSNSGMDPPEPRPGDSTIATRSFPSPSCP